MVRSQVVTTSLTQIGAQSSGCAPARATADDALAGRPEVEGGSGLGHDYQLDRQSGERRQPSIDGSATEKCDIREPLGFAGRR